MEVNSSLSSQNLLQVDGNFKHGLHALEIGLLANFESPFVKLPFISSTIRNCEAVKNSSKCFSIDLSNELTYFSK